MAKRKTAAADMATEWRKFGRQVEAAGINWNMWRGRVFNMLMQRGINPEAYKLPTTPKELAGRFQVALNREKRWPITGEELAELAAAWADNMLVRTGAAGISTPAGDTGAAKVGGLNIADTIGATAWGEIRLVIRPGGEGDAGGITFHCGKKHKAASWNDMGLHNAVELQGALMLLAREGLIDWGKHLDVKRRDFEARRAREQAAGKMRGRVNKLNAKFLKHFPEGWENPFFNDDGVTKHHFQKIEIQRTS